MNKTYYIGLDVHKETIAIAHALGGSRKEPVYHGQCGGGNLSAERGNSGSTNPDSASPLRHANCENFRR